MAKAPEDKRVTRGQQRERHPVTGHFLPEQKPSESFQRELDQGLVPTMTSDLALVFAKLLSVGCPPIRATLYCAPQLNETDAGRDTAKKVARQWAADVQVLEAITSINGGKWHELPAEKRYQLALEKHNAEWAFFLWTTNVNDVEHREGLEKLKQGRDVLKSLLGQQIDESDPMQAFARFAIELTKNAQAVAAAGHKRPIQTQKSDFETLLTEPKGKM